MPEFEYDADAFSELMELCDYYHVRLGQAIFVGPDRTEDLWMAPHCRRSQWEVQMFGVPDEC